MKVSMRSFRERYALYHVTFAGAWRRLFGELRELAEKPRAWARPWESVEAMAFSCSLVIELQYHLKSVHSQVSKS